VAEVLVVVDLATGDLATGDLETGFAESVVITLLLFLEDAVFWTAALGGAALEDEVLVDCDLATEAAGVAALVALAGLAPIGDEVVFLVPDAVPAFAPVREAGLAVVFAGAAFLAVVFRGVLARGVLAKDVLLVALADGLVAGFLAGPLLPELFVVCLEAPRRSAAAFLTGFLRSFEFCLRDLSDTACTRNCHASVRGTDGSFRLDHFGAPSKPTAGNVGCAL